MAAVPHVGHSAAVLVCPFTPPHLPHLQGVQAVQDQSESISMQSLQQLWSRGRPAATERRSQPRRHSVLLALELAQAGVQAAGGRLQAGLQRPAAGPGVQGAVLGLI